MNIVKYLGKGIKDILNKISFSFNVNYNTHDGKKNTHYEKDIKFEQRTDGYIDESGRFILEPIQIINKEDDK